eukprot:scaffold5250_cov102-Isochrysis_galbana.AAC.6
MCGLWREADMRSTDCCPALPGPAAASLARRELNALGSPCHQPVGQRTLGRVELDAPRRAFCAGAPPAGKVALPTALRLVVLPEFRQPSLGRRRGGLLAGPPLSLLCPSRSCALHVGRFGAVEELCVDEILEQDAGGAGLRHRDEQLARRLGGVGVVETVRLAAQANAVGLRGLGAAGASGEKGRVQRQAHAVGLRLGSTCAKEERGGTWGLRLGAWAGAVSDEGAGRDPPNSPSSPPALPDQASIPPSPQPRELIRELWSLVRPTVESPQLYSSSPQPRALCAPHPPPPRGAPFFPGKPWPPIASPGQALASLIQTVASPDKPSPATAGAANPPGRARPATAVRTDAVADHLGLGAGDGREDQARAVAQHQLGAVGHVKRLEVLGFARGGGDVCLFGRNHRVDRGRLTDVRVADQADGARGAAVGERRAGRAARQEQPQQRPTPQDARGGGRFRACSTGTDSAPPVR